MSAVKPESKSTSERKLFRTDSIHNQLQVPGSRHRGHRAVRLIISATNPGWQVLGTVAKEWLVPLLVEHFFAEQGLNPPQSANRANFLRSNFWTPVQGAREQRRVNTSL